MSDDGDVSIVAIFLVGSPFSPAYRRALQRDPNAPAERFASVNVAVYSRRSGSAWALTHHPSAVREDGALGIGASTIRWSEDRIEVTVDERRPWSGARVRGRLSLSIQTRGRASVALDRRGKHRWSPIAPLADIEVELDEPRLRFRGRGYHDCNAGDEPLDRAFREWTWSRVHAPEGRSLLSYAVTDRDGASGVHAAIVSPEGAEDVDVQPWRLPHSRWGLRRELWAPPGAAPRITQVLEDGPFYARHRVALRFDGHDREAVAETLSADRFGSSRDVGLHSFPVEERLVIETLVAAWGIVVAVVSARAVLGARHALPPQSEQPARLLVVRPCAGHEAGLARALRSTRDVGDRGARLRFAVASRADASSEVAQQIAVELRADGRDVEVVYTNPTAPNRKVDQLAAVVSRESPFDAAWILDSDVLVDALLARGLRAALVDPRVGAAWAAPVERFPSTLADRASAAVLDASLHSFSLLASLDRRGMVGKAFTIRADALLAIGGFSPSRDTLGEDMHLAERLRRAGLTVTFAGVPATSLASGRSVRDVWQRFARWIQVIRVQRTRLLPAYPLLFCSWPLVLAALPIAPHILAVPVALATLVRVAVACAAKRAALSPLRPSVVLDAFLADVLLLAAFVSALGSRSVRWRGARLLLRGGRWVEEPA